MMNSEIGKRQHELSTILIMATGGLPQSQLISLGSCGEEEKRSTRGPLGLDTTQR